VSKNTGRDTDQNQQVNFSEAAKNAYRLASRWGGEWSVMKAPDGAHHVFKLHSPSGIGMTEIGRVVSQMPELSWVWADGRNEVPPTSPFAKVNVIAPVAPTMSSLNKQEQALMEWMHHVTKIQRHFSHDRFRQAKVALGSQPERLPDEYPVPYAEYLAVVQKRGMVEAETQRLKRLVAAARDATGVGMTRESEQIIFGFTKLPEETAANGADKGMSPIA
jgi:hypothetical protein